MIFNMSEEDYIEIFQKPSFTDTRTKKLLLMTH